MTVETITSDAQAVDVIAAKLTAELEAGKRVLWLMGGGSGITIAVGVAKRIARISLERLTFGLTDERYGPVGHPDSNWKQLEAAGLSLPGATLHPTLYDLTLADTVEAEAAWLEDALANSDYRFGLFGMGVDGHTAGMLPGSGATEATNLVYGYSSIPFTRITMTIPAIEQLDAAALYARGSDKAAMLQRLVQTNISSAEQPVQILKRVTDFTVLTDQKEIA